jgi:hypothetical protein
MLSAAFLLVAVIDFALLIWALKLCNQYRTPALILATLPITLMWFDNLTIGLGSVIGEGNLLIGMNYVRFYSHFVLLPLTFIAIGSMARQVSFAWAQPKLVMATFCIIATFFMIDDVWRFQDKTLYPSCFADTLRYTTCITEHTACSPDVLPIGEAMPPIAPLTLTVMLIVFGVFMWLQRGWKWLVLGSVGTMLLFAMPYSKTGGIFSNVGEPIICGVIILTAAHIAQKYGKAS